MSMARRLAHRGGIAASVVSTPGAPRPSEFRDGPRAQGFVREQWEVEVRARSRVGARDPELSAIDLPSAPQLAKALAELGPLPRGGLNQQCPAVLLDLETTGLLGQAGALVCVVGAAWHVAPDRIVVVQWSLNRVASEGALLADVDAVLCERLGSDTAIVTFNGASFDVPVLRRRMVRHGIYSPTDDPLRFPHVDLLAPARRLWRDRGPDCRLGTLERRHLQLHRDGDVGGAEVVDLLWGWLEEPSDETAEDLARVQRHNRIDVLSLAAMAQTLHARLRAPTDTVERLRAARHYLRLGRPKPARMLLAPLLDTLARSRTPGRGSELAVEAGLLVAEMDRKAGHHEHAARWWARVCRRVPGHPEAHEALAKHLEHRERAPCAAVAVAAASVTPCERRLTRLRRKAADGSIPAISAVVDAWADRQV